MTDEPDKTPQGGRLVYDATENREELADNSVDADYR
jgi:hypothetical protein